MRIIVAAESPSLPFAPLRRFVESITGSWQLAAPFHPKKKRKGNKIKKRNVGKSVWKKIERRQAGKNGKLWHPRDAR